MGHEPQYRENGKTGHKTGQTVQQAQVNTISVEKNTTQQIMLCDSDNESWNKKQEKQSEVQGYRNLLVTVVIIFVVAPKSC